MLEAFDRRVLPDAIVELVRRLQAVEPCHLAGGAALAGAHLAHRRSRDIDLFVHDAAAHRRLCARLADVVESLGGSVQVVQDAGAFFRARAGVGEAMVEVDLVFERAPDLEAPPPPVEGVVIESFADLRAAKLTCLLERSEPRDLVDLLFLDRAGHPPEADLPLALRKDAGVDPGVLAWLLRSFPLEPLPDMLEPLSVAELRAFRDDLCDRFRSIAVQDEPG